MGESQILLQINHTIQNNNSISFPEIWRDYVGYDIDLDLLPVIPHPDLVSNGDQGDYMELVDGDLATCVFMETTKCSVGVKVA